MIRVFDILFSLTGTILLFPVFFILYIAISWKSKGGSFYKQLRVGRYGKDFYVYKFRSMCMDSDKKGFITIGEKDPRITKVGYIIRKYKLDELPQLFNVLKGDMSLVGPRPEVRKYVDLYTGEQRKILSVRPGITDYASIEYIDENIILGNSNNPNRTYVELIMPDKIRCNMKYIDNRSLKEYFKILFLTLGNIIHFQQK
jgi:lipopolysaccharide/colanic/teichoic acid biosynthesis glycosyltransferase